MILLKTMALVLVLDNKFRHIYKRNVLINHRKPFRNILLTRQYCRSVANKCRVLLIHFCQQHVRNCITMCNVRWHCYKHYYTLYFGLQLHRIPIYNFLIKDMRLVIDWLMFTEKNNDLPFGRLIVLFP